jgi:hypothetical protein
VKVSSEDVGLARTATGRWALELDVTIEDGQFSTFATTFEYASRVAGSPISVDVVEPHGPGGGWPIVRFAGELASMLRLAAEYHDEPEILGWKEEDLA